jgi:hypothetical protein
MSDILKPVREKLLEDYKKTLPDTPELLTSTYARAGGWAGAVSGALAGGSYGTSIGIATGGFGMAATVPLAIIGGVVGYFGGEKIGSKFER